MKLITISITDSKKAKSLILNSNKLTNVVKILSNTKVLIDSVDLNNIVKILDRNYIKYSI
jgi:hypothetical protein